MAEPRHREETVRRWQELGPAGRIELGASLIDLGTELADREDRRDPAST
jgi:hypothetical protein